MDADRPPNPLLVADARAAVYRFEEACDRMIEDHPEYRADIEEMVENIYEPLRSPQSLARTTDEVCKAAQAFIRMVLEWELYGNSYTPDIDDSLDRVCGAFGVRRASIEEEAREEMFCNYCHFFSWTTQGGVCMRCYERGYG
jgi:HAMP domain-containing protein